MIIGFLGKGGSGKTTLSSGFATYLASKGNNVLAIDADHNMDMAYNLNVPETMNYIGQSLPEILSHLELKTYRDAFNQITDPEFSFNPKDPITEKYSVVIDKNLHAMVAGPHTSDILYDKSCSHALTTPLKVYLPFLKLKEKEYAVIDEKAGADGVGTGVTTGFNLACVVAESTPYGIKAAKQIIDLLKFYQTPHILILNKAEEGDETLFKEMIGQEPDVIFTYKKEASRFSKEIIDMYESEFNAIKKVVDSISDTRKERTKAKYQKNFTYID